MILLLKALFPINPVNNFLLIYVCDAGPQFVPGNPVMTIVDPYFYFPYSLVCVCFKPSRCIKAAFWIPENRFNFPTTRGFRTKIPIKLVHQYMAIFFIFQTTSSHLNPLQVENCDSNSRLVVDEDDNGKFRLEKVNLYNAEISLYKPWKPKRFL